MVVGVDLPLAPVLERHLRGGSATGVPEVHGGTPAAPARAEEQGVHDGAGHELDDARRARLLAPRAARTWGFPGRRTAAVGCSRRHRQRVHFLGQVVVAVGQLGEGLEGVLIGLAGVVWLRRGSPGGWMMGGAGAVPQLNGWWMLGEWLRTTWCPPYRFWGYKRYNVMNICSTNLYQNTAKIINQLVENPHLMVPTSQTL